MNLFRRKRSADASTPAPYETIAAWAQEQYARQADSYEAQSLVLQAREDGWEDERTMFVFHQQHWQSVLIETMERFPGGDVRRLLSDLPATEKAVRAAAPRLFPLTSTHVIERQMASLRAVWRREGWDPS